MARCPVCTMELVDQIGQQGDRLLFSCPRCGCYSLSRSAHSDLPGWLDQFKDTGRAVLSHVLYQMSKRKRWAMMTTELLENTLNNTKLPKPQEQLENFILWLGESLPDLGTVIDDDGIESAIAATGAGDRNSFAFLVQEAHMGGWILGEVVEVNPPQVMSLRLTMQGWNYYDELKRGKSMSRLAFLAMKYGDEEADAIFLQHFKPAVEQTGFELKRLDEGQPAGLIDDRLRVEIRQSRFLVADLTHHNNGAYWEAGYAEGLGKPVIYTCRRDVFEDMQQGTHFDTNHHLTVVWSPDDLPSAVVKLKATIRATLPGEAIMAD